jgi:hypothetical protein
MRRNVFAVTSVSVLLALVLACTKSSSPLTPSAPSGGGSGTSAEDGSTLKATAPVPQSPINGVKPSTGPATLVASPSTTPFASGVPLQYRFQIFNSANVLVDDSLESEPRYDVQVDLAVNLSYTWQARAESGGEVGPWSTMATFIAPESAFLNSQLSDPLTNGRTVGVQHGGTFIPGVGWQALSLQDGIDYDLTEPCVDDCRLEFDVTNFGPREGDCCAKDLKWLSMGNAADFGSFGAFRDHPWKMHLVQRADYETGMEIIWRNGDAGDGDDPGDHRIKLTDTGIVFRSTDVYHFTLEWSTTGYRIDVNGEEVMSDGWCCPYAPPVHRISLGCYPRDETITGAIYRNIKLRKF